MSYIFRILGKILNIVVTVFSLIMFLIAFPFVIILVVIRLKRHAPIITIRILKLEISAKSGGSLRNTVLSKNPERKEIKYWEYLLIMLPGGLRKEATYDLEDIIEDLKERRATKAQVFLMVFMHLIPLLPALISGRIPLTAKKKSE